MRMHPLVTVKKAASILGVGKETIREKLMSGELKGEIRRIGLKDKWFIYSGEVDYLLENQRLPELESKTDRVSTKDMGEFFEPTLEPTKVELSDSDTTDSAVSTRTSEELIPSEPTSITWGIQTDQLEGVLELLTKQFSLRILEQHQRMEEFKQSFTAQADLSKEVALLQEKLAQQERLNSELTEEVKRLRAELLEMKEARSSGGSFSFKNFFAKIGSNA